jgi:peptide/nickel transport system permease protein
MLRFIVRRLLLGVVVLWAIATVVFIMFFVAPHNVARLLAGRQATPETVALVQHRLGLDRPVLTQYLDFLGRVLHGDLGYSYYNSTAVTDLIESRIAVTVSLAIGAAVIWLVLGISFGVIASVRPRSWVDRLVTATSLLLYSMPVFLVGLIFLYFLFYRLTLAGYALFPASGYVPITQDPLSWAHHLILPWITLALTTAATYTRLTRGAMLDVLDEDYIRTARAKGMSERRVVYRHALRSALTPAVTQLGIDLGVLLGGAIITEQVFGLQGLGALAVQSVVQQDLPVIIGTVLLAAAFIVLSSIVVDILYAVLDPRVRVH